MTLSTWSYRLWKDPSRKYYKWRWEVLRNGKLYSYYDVMPETGIVEFGLHGSRMTKRAAMRSIRRAVRKHKGREWDAVISREAEEKAKPIEIVGFL